MAIAYICKGVKKRILYLFLLLVFANGLKADHIVGSEISYIYKSTNLYTILTKVYRNCNDCKLNGNGGGTNPDNCNDIGMLDLYGYNPVQKKYIKLASITTTRKSIRDLTELCPGEVSTCNTSSTYGFGVEEHIFESEIDLTTHLDNNYSEFKFSITIDARSPGISSSSLVQNHFNFCYLNTEIVQQSSPYSFGLPFNRINTNNAIYASAQYQSNGFDSISYALDTAYISETIQNSYPVGHSPDKPVGVISGSDALAYKPKGVTLDAQSGQLTFTPNIAPDIGVFVIECRGFIKDINGNNILSSIVRKDFECVIGNGNNNSPYFYGLTGVDWQACEGEIFSEDIYYRDESVGGLNDTVYLSESSLNPYSLNLLHTIQNYAPYRTTNFDWTVPDGSARKEPYTFTILATDSSCPKPGISYYNFRIKVSKAKKITATKIQTNCNEFLFTAADDIDTDNLRFSILDKDKNELPSSIVFNDSARLTFPSKGKWYVRLISVEESAPCSYIFIDSVDIADFKTPEINHANDYRVCPDKSITIAPIITIFNGPAQFDWIINGTNIGNNSTSLDTFFSSTQTIITRVKDALGCKVEDSLQISVKPKWDNTLTDTGVCLNFADPIYLPSAVKDTGALLSYMFIGTNVTGSHFNAMSLGLGKYTIKVNVRDTVSCTYEDSFIVEIGNPFEIESTSLGTFCQKATNINLNDIAKPKPVGGSWSFDPFPLWISGSTFLLDESDSGSYHLKYSITQKGCTVDTLLPITIEYAPEITLKTPIPDSLCENAIPIEIDILESPATYDINGVQDSVLDPSLYKGEAVVQVIRNHSLNACSHTFRKVVTIDTLIQTALQFSANPVCFEDDSITLSLDNNLYASTWSQNGSGIFENKGGGIHLYKITSIEKTNLTPIEFTVILKSENTCPDKTIQEEVLQNPSFHMDYDSFILDHCALGMLRLSVYDNHFLYYDSVQWFLNANAQKGNGFSNNKHTFSNMAAGVSSIQVIPFKYSCQSTFDTFIEIFPKPDPQISASPDKFYSARFPNIKFNINNFNPTFNYSWRTQPKHIVLTGNNPYDFQMPSDTGRHQFTLFTTSDKGCKDTLTYTVIALPKDWIYIPNAFTPNNDGPSQNELFKPEGRVSSNYMFQIFNFWGEKIFESNDISQGWDGTYGNKKCEPGTYFYVVKFVDDVGRPNLMKAPFVLLY